MGFKWKKKNSIEFKLKKLHSDSKGCKTKIVQYFAIYFWKTNAKTKLLHDFLMYCNISEFGWENKRQGFEKH